MTGNDKTINIRSRTKIFKGNQHAILFYHCRKKYVNHSARKTSFAHVHVLLWLISAYNKIISEVSDVFSFFCCYYMCTLNLNNYAVFLCSFLPSSILLFYVIFQTPPTNSCLHDTKIGLYCEFGIMYYCTKCFVLLCTEIHSTGKTTLARYILPTQN